VVEPLDDLILDLLEWMGPTPRRYDDVLEVWRTSCPRLPVWEEARDRGYVVRCREPGQGQLITVSPAGTDHLRRHRSTVPA
jgi:D-3-phosphoglycerate dehydrogenase / 2-oxoglutarate reductase